MIRVEGVQWLLPWEPSALVVVVFAIIAILYVRGRVRRPPKARYEISFWLGIITMYAVSHTQFDYYSEHAFFVHRIQHAILHHVAPFMIAFSRSGPVLAAGLPIGWNDRLRKAVQDQTVREVARFVNTPLVAGLLFCGLVVFWLIPSVHFLAMLDWKLYRLMNWSMAINGLMFWSLALNNFCFVPAGLSATRRIVLLLGVIPPQIAIGMLLVVMPREIYPLYSLCGRALAISPLADQQLGGFILWVPAAMMSVLGVLVVMKRDWMKREIPKMP